MPCNMIINLYIEVRLHQLFAGLEGRILIPRLRHSMTVFLKICSEDYKHQLFVKRNFLILPPILLTKIFRSYNSEPTFLKSTS